ncbi:MAG: 16S rRNA (guanine(966)-N(2))-methyltransferase RsmD [Flavobacteriales bacterium]|jgi:16S rRNA (guanine(966)-N(2))-methyltransferase RsmD|nr:16S rRNA (guanine(966)-N(2))-methyltransferase RsmD [Flavobacteriales bacterium]
MRIIRGKYRNKRLIAPSNLPVRPTTDMAKEALFNILDNYVYFEDISVLDLYAGTGNISYEFASRDTQRIDAVEAHSKCVYFIRKTSTELGFEEQINAVHSKVEAFLKKTNQKYDIVFADPPYESSEYEGLYDWVMEADILNENGFLVIEHSRDTNYDDKPYFLDRRKYGNVHFSIFKKTTDQ